MMLPRLLARPVLRATAVVAPRMVVTALTVTPLPPPRSQATTISAAAATMRSFHVHTPLNVNIAARTEPMPPPSQSVIIDLFADKLNPSHVYTLTPEYEEENESESESPAEEVKKVFAVDANAPFSELGLDSLDLVELMVGIEKTFKHEFSDADYEDVKNIEDIIAIIHKHPRAALQTPQPETEQ